MKRAATLRHPQIVHIIDYGRDKDGYYITMEYITGHNLAHYLAQKIPWQVSLIVLKYTAHALSYAHQQKVLHQGLKLENILVSEKGVVKLTDFGNFHLNSTGEVALKTSSRVIGAPFYLSPEQIKGEEVDQRSDIFSLGAIFYLLFTGKRPFLASTSQAILHQILFHQPLPVNKLNPEIPAELVKLTQRCLAKKPQNRPQELAEIIQVLEKVLAELPIKAPQQELKKYLFNPPRYKFSPQESVFKIPSPIVRSEKRREKQTKEGRKEEKLPLSEIGFSGGMLLVVLLVLFFFSWPEKKEKKVLSTEEKLSSSTDSRGEIFSVGLPRKRENSERRELSQPELLISSSPQAEVYIDGIAYGTLPLKKPIKLSPGEHQLVLKNPYCYPRKEKIVLKENKLYRKNFKLQFKPSRLMIRNLPRGAKVYLNGKLWEKESFIRPQVLAPGRYQLELSHPDYKEWRREIEIKPGRVTYLEVKMKQK